MVKHTIGKCNYCDAVYTKTWMKKHLLSCEKRQKTETEAGKKQKKGVEMYLLAVQAEYRPEFWLFVEVSATLKLREIDQFLRDIWLECCGHLSQFRISNQIYACPDAQKDEKNEMNTSLKKALKGSNITKFSYEYDFGSTTYLNFEVIGTRNIARSNKSIIVLARNELPKLRCESCDEYKVTTMCMECLYDGRRGYLCEACLADHECDEEMFMPLVNSPRTGVCGYVGNRNTDNE